MIYPSHIPYPNRVWPFYRSYQAGWDAREKLEIDVAKLLKESEYRTAQGYTTNPKRAGDDWLQKASKLGKVLEERRHGETTSIS